MKLIEATKEINKLANKPFKDYLPASRYNDIIKNKGKTGQILELTIGLSLSNTTLDFEDGELKTNKCDKNGNPKETMFITQISSMIDDILEKKPFRKTKLYKKIQNILYVPISKDGNPEQWMYLPCIQVDLSQPQYSVLAKQLEADYYTICNEMNQQLSESPNSMLHTANGKFIQVRTKDSTPYHPIYSQKYGREISNKNRAFYFKKDFMRYIVSLQHMTYS